MTQSLDSHYGLPVGINGVDLPEALVCATLQHHQFRSRVVVLRVAVLRFVAVRFVTLSLFTVIISN